jgi:hypothetical protein
MLRPTREETHDVVVSQVCRPSLQIAHTEARHPIHRKRRIVVASASLLCEPRRCLLDSSATAVCSHIPWIARPLLWVCPQNHSYGQSRFSPTAVKIEKQVHGGPIVLEPPHTHPPIPPHPPIAGKGLGGGGGRSYDNLSKKYLRH